MLAGVIFLLAMPRGRAQWSRPGLWLASAIASIGLLPLIFYNVGSQGAGIAFQVVERNPWRFHADALVQPLEQAVTCTPVAWAVMLWALWRSWRRRDEAPFDAVAIIAGTFVVAYFVLGLFADDMTLPRALAAARICADLRRPAGPASRCPHGLAADGVRGVRARRFRPCGWLGLSGAGRFEGRRGASRRRQGLPRTSPAGAKARRRSTSSSRFGRGRSSWPTTSCSRQSCASRWVVRARCIRWTVP